jgi:hypothetical protein
MAGDGAVANPGAGGLDFAAFYDGSTYSWPGTVCAYVASGSANNWTLQQVQLANGLPVQPGTSTTWAISAVSLPLPTGAATAALQTTGNSSLSSIVSALGGSLAVTGTFFQATQPVSASSLPLPTGAATSALQTTGNTTLASILSALGGSIAVTGTFFQTTQPVSIASTITVDIAASQTIAVTNAGTFAVQAAQNGTWTVQPGNTPNTTPWLANHQDPAATTGSITAADVASTSTTNSISQTYLTGSPTAGSFVPVTLSSETTMTVQLSGTFSGTVVVEGSLDGGTTWQARGCEQIGLGTSSSTFAISDNKAYLLRVNVGGYTNFRARCTVYTSGTLTVRFQPGFGAGVVIANQGLPQSAAASAWLVSAAQSGTWNIGTVTTVTTVSAVTAITNALPAGTNTIGGIVDTPATSGGLSVSSFLSTAAVQATNVKATAGQIYSLEFFNNSATIAYLRLYNKASAPGTGDTPIWRGLIPANTSGAGLVKAWEKGLPCSLGIGFRCTGAVADNDATALAANAILGNIGYA